MKKMISGRMLKVPDIAAERVVSNERVFAELEIMLSLPWLR